MSRSLNSRSRSTTRKTQRRASATVPVRSRSGPRSHSRPRSRSLTRSRSSSSSRSRSTTSTFDSYTNSRSSSPTSSMSTLMSRSSHSTSDSCPRPLHSMSPLTPLTALSQVSYSPITSHSTPARPSASRQYHDRRTPPPIFQLDSSSDSDDYYPQVVHDFSSDYENRPIERYRGSPSPSRSKSPSCRPRVQANHNTPKLNVVPDEPYYEDSPLLVNRPKGSHTHPRLFALRNEARLEREVKEMPLDQHDVRQMIPRRPMPHSPLVHAPTKQSSSPLQLQDESLARAAAPPCFDLEGLQVTHLKAPFRVYSLQQAHSSLHNKHNVYVFMFTAIMSTCNGNMNLEEEQEARVKKAIEAEYTDVDKNESEWKDYFEQRIAGTRFIHLTDSIIIYRVQRLNYAMLEQYDMYSNRPKQEMWIESSPVPIKLAYGNSDKWDTINLVVTQHLMTQYDHGMMSVGEVCEFNIAPHGQPNDEYFQRKLEWGPIIKHSADSFRFAAEWEPLVCFMENFVFTNMCHVMSPVAHFMRTERGMFIQRDMFEFPGSASIDCRMFQLGDNGAILTASHEDHTLEKLPKPLAPLNMWPWNGSIHRLDIKPMPPRREMLQKMPELTPARVSSPIEPKDATEDDYITEHVMRFFYLEDGVRHRVEKRIRVNKHLGFDMEKLQLDGNTVWRNERNHQQLCDDHKRKAIEYRAWRNKTRKEDAGKFNRYQRELLKNANP